MRHSDDLMTIQLDGLAEPAGTEGGLTTAANAWTPPVDLFESHHAFLVKVDVPGVRACDLRIAFTGGLLVIGGARYLAAGPDGERFHRLERPGGSFRRSIVLPTAASPETVGATVQDGVLTIVVPKVAPPRQARIAVHPVRTPVAWSRQAH